MKTAQTTPLVVSPNVAKLLQKLRAQVSKEAVEQGLSASGDVLLPRPAYTRWKYHDHGAHRCITYSDAAGNQISLQTPHLPDAKYLWMKPGLWYGQETRVDALGCRWTHLLPCNYVMDDFGSLVEVPK